LQDNDACDICNVISVAFFPQIFYYLIGEECILVLIFQFFEILMWLFCMENDRHFPYPRWEANVQMREVIFSTIDD
jgi:hypothetical protein